MPRPDTENTGAARPTIAEEVAKFTSFATNDGETITKDKPEDLNPVAGKNTSKAEDDRAAALAAEKEGKAPAAKGPAPKEPNVKLTDEESEKTIADLDAKLGREANDEEIAAALKAATAEKNKPAAGKEAPKKSVADRIGKAVRNQRAAERERDEARRERDEARAALAAAGKAPLTDDKKSANAVDDDKEPDPKDFEFGELDAKFIRALARWETKQEIARSNKNQEKTQLTAAQQKAADDFKVAKDAFEDAGSELYDDFSEVVIQGAKDKVWPLSNTLGSLLLDSEHGPRIAYELASDPKEAKRIFGLSEARQAAWFGTQEAKLIAGSGAKTDEEDGQQGSEETDGKKPAAKVSKAPAPVQRARGQGSAERDGGSTNDFAAFEAKAMAALRKK